MESRPKITLMGEEVDWDSLEDPAAVDITDYFKPVRLSAKAIDQASRVVPIENWISAGLHTWLQGRANHVFSKLPSINQREGRLGKLKYVFEFDASGPVLKTVFLG